jgi:hypothetical protein
VACHLKPEAELYYLGIKTAHPDNERFISDFERVDGRKIQEITGKFKDQFEVIESRKYINGPAGAPCTSELKIKLREQVKGIHIFGFTIEEEDRADRFRLRNPEILTSFPLLEARLTKKACKDYVQDLGIQVPRMYELGYKNNNCIGCVKGGRGYWKKIRRDFPAYFERMAGLERKIGASCINGIFLDELDNSPELFEEAPECSHFCGGY